MFGKMNKMSKRKGFLIDKISEDSFYENLLLGLTLHLKTCQFVSQIKLERYSPATLEEVCYWENFNGLHLPNDLRNFFLSTNGFSLTYKFQYDKAESEEVNYIMAGIEINPLAKMDKIVTSETTYLTEDGRKILAPYSKIHIVTKIDESNFIVLAQFNASTPPSYWMYYKTKIFYFLAEDFVTYFRMALAHVGIPGWQFSLLKASIPEWSAEMMQILAPGIYDNRQFENKSELNKLDLNIFNITDDPSMTSVCPQEDQSGDTGSMKKRTKNKSKK